MRGIVVYKHGVKIGKLCGPLWFVTLKDVIDTYPKAQGFTLKYV